MSDGHGVFGETAELPKPKHDIYCPAQDQSFEKYPDRLNYFKVNCAGRLKDDNCSFRGCPIRSTVAQKTVIPEYEYVFFGCGVRRASGSSWAIYDLNHDKVKIERSLTKCKDYILENLKVG